MRESARAPLAGLPVELRSVWTKEKYVLSTLPTEIPHVYPINLPDKLNSTYRSNKMVIVGLTATI